VEVDKDWDLGMEVQAGYSTLAGQTKTFVAKIEALFPAGRFVLECTFVRKGDPKTIEDQLLGAYLVDHCELPPANHNHPGKLGNST